MPPQLGLVFNLIKNATFNNLDCITVYRSMDNWSESIIKSELQNQIKVALQQCTNKLSGLQINALASQIIQQIITLPFYKKSVGIFITADFTNPEDLNFTLNENIVVAFSDIPVSDYQSCSKVFSLTNLFKMTQNFEDNLCIYISRKETKFFLLNSEFKHIKTIENVILEAYEDRFRNRTPGATGVIHGGSAADEKESKFSKKILNDAIENLKEFAKQQNQYKNIIVFYSNDFAPFADFLTEQLKFFSSAAPCLEIKIIDNEANFENEFKQALANCTNKITEEKLNKYKTSIDGTFKKELEDIVSAAAEARIQKVYIKEDFRTKGYILNRDLPYTTKTDGSVETENLNDWILKKVFETGGEVFVLDKDSPLLEVPFVAKLRY